MNQRDLISDCYLALFTALEHMARCEWTFFAYYFGKCVQVRQQLLNEFHYDIKTESQFGYRYDTANMMFMNRCEP